MKKLTTKILADMLMVKNTEFTIKLQELHTKLLEETSMICKCYDLIAQFPNLQMSKDFQTLWTPEVNPLVYHATVEEIRDDFDYWIEVSPFVIIDEIKIFGNVKGKYYDEELDNYQPFMISCKGIECKGWQDTMNMQKIPKIVIRKIEDRLRKLAKKFD